MTPDSTATSPSAADAGPGSRVTVERRGHVLLIGLDRPEKRNAADIQLLTELSRAYAVLEREPQVRVGVVFAHGEHFTAGLDLADIAPRIGVNGLDITPDDGIDPWQLSGARLTKPVVIAVQGTCLTLGIELMLASDIAIAAESTRFAQIEVSRGILPFGGATIRFPRAVGWGNAMRWILTGDSFDAAEAHRMGLVQEVAPTARSSIAPSRSPSASQARRPSRCRRLSPTRTSRSKQTTRRRPRPCNPSS